MTFLSRCDLCELNMWSRKLEFVTYIFQFLQIRLRKIISQLSDLQYFNILNVKLFIECRNSHSKLSQGQFILMGGFENFTLFSGATNFELLFKNILKRLLANKNDWSKKMPNIDEFRDALNKDVELAKLAIMQSFLRRKEQDTDEKDEEKFFYRWSSRYVEEGKKANIDLSKDYNPGQTICISRYVY